MLARDPQSDERFLPRGVAWLLFALAIPSSALLIWLVLGLRTEPELPTPPLKLQPTAEGPHAALENETGRRSTPDALEVPPEATDRRLESGTALPRVQGSIRGWRQNHIVLVFRDEHARLHAAELDPIAARYRVQLAPGYYRAHFHAPEAENFAFDLQIAPTDLEIEHDIEPRWWPCLPIDLLASGGAPLLSALPEQLYGWNRAQGLANLGLQLEYQGLKQPIDASMRCVLKAPLPIEVRLHWNSIILGTQLVSDPHQRIVFEVDAEIFHRGEPAQLRCQALNASNDAPAVGVRILVRHSFGEQRCSVNTTDGSVLCSDLAPGEVSLHIGGDAFVAQELAFTLEPGADRDIGSVRCAAAVPSAPEANSLTPCELHLLALSPLELWSADTEPPVRWMRVEEPTIQRLHLPVGAYTWRNAAQDIVGNFTVASSDVTQLIAWP